MHGQAEAEQLSCPPDATRDPRRAGDQLPRRVAGLEDRAHEGHDLLPPGNELVDREHLHVRGRRAHPREHAGEVVPDEPTYVATLKQRHEFVTNRLFNALEADEDDHLEEDIEELDLEIQPNTFRMSGAGVAGGSSASRVNVDMGQSHQKLMV